MADRERKKTYEAENVVRVMSERGGAVELYGTTVQWPVEKRFGSLDHIQTYVDWVMRQPWFAGAYPRASKTAVRVRRRKGERMAHYDPLGHEIAIHDPEFGKPGWAMREIVVLHELAHHVHRLEDGFVGESHGPEYRAVFVHLVTEVIGPEAGWVLSTVYYDAGLRVAIAGAKKS